MSLNWVMTSDSGAFVPLPNERHVYTSPSRIALTLKTPSSYPGTRPINVSSSTGIIYLTSQRLIYLPSQPTDALRSFAAPIRNIRGPAVTAPFFGPNTFQAMIEPVPGGGMPQSRTLIELKMVFKEGGAFDFHSQLLTVKERLQQAEDVARDSGHITGGGPGTATNPAIVHLDQLPAYEQSNEASPVPISLSTPSPTFTPQPAAGSADGGSVSLGSRGHPDELANGTEAGASVAEHEHRREREYELMVEHTHQGEPENGHGVVDAPQSPPPGYEGH